LCSYQDSISRAVIFSPDFFSVRFSDFFFESLASENLDLGLTFGEGVPTSPLRVAMAVLTSSSE
jgi:hypothetical protein